jgi:hypothetical protein
MYELPRYSQSIAIISSYNGTAYVLDDRGIEVLFPVGANRPEWPRVRLNFIISEPRGLVPQDTKQLDPQTDSSPSSAEVLER